MEGVKLKAVKELLGLNNKKVKVLSVDEKRKRIALTMKLGNN